MLNWKIYILLCTVVTGTTGNVIAQIHDNYNKSIIQKPIASVKPAFDFQTMEISLNTEKLGNFAAISHDGRYCSYVIDGPKPYTIVQATEGTLKYKVPIGIGGFFSGDNRFYIYQSADSLCYLSLSGGNTKITKDVVAYQLPADDNRNEWVAISLNTKNVLLKNLLTDQEMQFNDVANYAFSGQGAWFSCQLNNMAKEMFTVQLTTGKLRRYENVIAYSFSQNLQTLVLQTENKGVKRLKMINPHTGDGAIVELANSPDSGEIVSYTVDKGGQRLLLVVQSKSCINGCKSLWYYKAGMKSAVLKKLRNSNSKAAGLELVGAPEFSGDGQYIVASMKKPGLGEITKDKNAVQVNVWNYQDTFLMSVQAAGTGLGLNEWLKEETYTFSMLAEGEGMTSFLSGGYERLFLGGGKEYAFVGRQIITDRFWEDWAKPETYIVSLRDGQRINFRKGINPQFSPDGTWILCYDNQTGQYFRYDNNSKLYTELSGGVTTFFGAENEFNGTGRQPQLPRGIAGWVEGGRSLLVYDHYDIWQLDITGKKPAVNLTNGRRNKIRFEITKTNESEDVNKTFYGSHDRLMLTAVNMENKDNGFYALTLGGKKDPEQLYMGPKVLYLGGLNYGQSFWGSHSLGRKPLKARDADTWLLIQQSVTEAPNYCVSRGLKEFRALTNFQPHQDYNWLKAELINFRQQDGSKCQGILYKPENFDPSKKYPVIIHYYDQFSLCLNQYPVTDYTVSAFINIPWFVSRGYLVFATDIYFNKGAYGTPGIKETKIAWGEAAMNAVEGAASWLSKQYFVDSTKLGIAGHSMGGGLTSYLVTHSKRFAAAFMGAGVTDWVSSALQLDCGAMNCGDGTSRLSVDYYSGPTGSDIWTNNAKYVDNPILHVAEVTSPLLMFHCKNDGGVPFEQAVEMFIAMRRMGKKAWLLEYDQGGHQTQNQKDSRDLTIRATQFFDHYLKGAPPPIWMTCGIRAQFKQIETGYEFDTTGRQP